MEKAEQPHQEGDIKVVDGKKYRYEKSGYTIRQYYAHESEKGPGPGWDFRAGLLNEESALKNFGRTFSVEQVYGDEPLPDDPYFVWREVFDKEGEEEKR